MPNNTTVPLSPEDIANPIAITPSSTQVSEGISPFAQTYTTLSPDHTLYFGIGVLIFFAITIACITYKFPGNSAPEDIVKAFGLPLIIFSAVILVVAGFGPHQIGAVVGLLGTVAGYLLGRQHKAKQG